MPRSHDYEEVKTGFCHRQPMRSAAITLDRRLSAKRPPGLAQDRVGWALLGPEI